jgi:hypothetical protein
VGRRVGNIRDWPRPYPATVLSSFSGAITGSTRIHRILEEVGSIACPGVFDTLSAKLAHRAGFPMAFVSGYSVSATAIGAPDMGLLTQTELIDRARRICLSVSIPVIVDANTGYGNPLNVHRTVAELIAARAAGCFLEDQVWAKRRGHMRGKRVIGPGHPRRSATVFIPQALAGAPMLPWLRIDRLPFGGTTANPWSAPGVLPSGLAFEGSAARRRIDLPSRPRCLLEEGRRSSAPDLGNLPVTYVLLWVLRIWEKEQMPQVA